MIVFGRPRVSTLFLGLLVLVLALPTPASALRLVRVAGGFDSPVHVAVSNRGTSLYVVEQEGQIWRLGAGGRSLFLDIRDLVAYNGGERGLFSVAFSRNYARSRYLYVNYTDNGGDVRVARFRANESFRRARRSTRRMILDVEHSTYPNHNGGQLAFGPNGRLYVSVGDGGGSCDPGRNAQDLSSRKGKLLSIAPGRLGAGWRIDGYGLRNLWRFSFDRPNGRFYGADVGQNRWEEVNTLGASRLGGRPENFLWARREGYARAGCASGGLRGRGARVWPVDVYSHAQGCSVSGGHVYRGRQLPSRLRGWYFFGDYCSGRIWRLKLNADGRLVRRARLVRNTALNVSSFGERRNGELLVVDLRGTIYRLAR
ncbi:MAG: PQQ-dependent sugar dehydrogenase [Gaiellaceae bacterium]